MNDSSNSSSSSHSGGPRGRRSFSGNRAPQRSGDAARPPHRSASGTPGDRPASTGFSRNAAPRPYGSRPGYAGSTPRPSYAGSTSSTPRPGYAGSTPRTGYAGSTPRPYSGDRPRFNSSTSRPGGYGRPQGFSGNRSGGGRRFKDQKIDVSRFISKAVIIEEEPIFVPDHNFQDFKIDDRIKANLARKGYTTPTPIQDRAIPQVHRGVDVVGIANTGTGKTAAFLIPLIDRVLNERIRVVVVAPTRELAVQIEEELKSFVPGLGIHSACCVGGAPMGRQISDLRRNPAFVVGTPGRLKDMMQQRHLDLSGFSAMVLDEADRMLDMGFVVDMRFMMAKLPKERQMLLFTATMSREIEAIIGDFLREPVRISVKTGETAKNVEQDIIRIPPGKKKDDILEELLRRPGFEKVIVFGRTKHGVQKLSTILNHAGLKTDAIHGNKTHAQRMRALTAFKDGRIQALIATDVAARGLDVSNISHVINYDIPGTYDDYVHRIGRTGRGNKRGVAITLVE